MINLAASVITLKERSVERSVEMSVKVKSRRHSFSSLEEAAKEIGRDSPSSVQSSVVIGKKRKQPEASSQDIPETKRPAGPAGPVSLAQLVESLQGNSVREPSKSFSADEQCCLPGGMTKDRLGDEMFWLFMLIIDFINITLTIVTV